jgi:hypothetical protein
VPLSAGSAGGSHPAHVSRSTLDYNDAVVRLRPEVFDRATEKRQLDVREPDEPSAGDVDLNRGA